MAQMIQTHPSSRIFVLDLCPIPPAYADNLGNSGVIQDSWEGFEIDGTLRWNHDAPDAVEEPTTMIAHPASAIDTLESAFVNTALTPLFMRCLSSWDSSPVDGLVLLIPAGVSPETCKILRKTAAAAGWRGDIGIADGSVLYATALACFSEIPEFTCAVMRERESLIEASQLHVQKQDHSLFITLHRQYRDADIAAVQRRGVADGLKATHTLVRSLHAEENPWLIRVAETVELIRRGKLALEVNRCGVIGIRSGEMDLLPMMDETADITAECIYSIAAEKQDLPRLEFWFGYPGSAVHPLVEMKLISHRFAAAPKSLTCKVVRLLDGRVDIALQWEGGRLQNQTAFPILWN